LRFTASRISAFNLILRARADSFSGGGLGTDFRFYKLSIVWKSAKFSFVISRRSSGGPIKTALNFGSSNTASFFIKVEKAAVSSKKNASLN